MSDESDFTKREEQRRKVKQLMFEAHNAGDKGKVKAFASLLTDKLQYTFDELYNKPSYVQALKDDYKDDTGEDFTGNVQDLIEEDFEHFNIVDASLVGGGAEILKSATQLSPEQKKRALTRFNTYTQTSGFGEGSRPGWEQFKSVLTGVGLDIGTTGGLGALTKRLFGKELSEEALKKALSPKQKAAAISGGYGALSDVERQTLEMVLGGREDYAPTQTAVAGGLGAVVPGVTQPLGAAVGKVGRAVTHPLQSASTFVKSVTGGYGAQAAAKGVTKEASDSIRAKGSDIESGSNRLQRSLFDAMESTDVLFRKRFDAFPLSNISADEVAKVHSQWSKTIGLPMEGAADRVIAKLKAGKLSSVDALRELKGILWDVGQKSGTKSDKGEYFTLRNKLMSLEEKSAIAEGRGLEYSKLKKAYGEWTNLTKTPIGKKILKSANDAGEAGKLVKSMVSGDFAWSQLSSFTKSVRKIEKLSGQEGLAKSLRKNIQEAAGELLLKDNSRGLIKLLNTKHAMNTLKNLYPGEAPFWTRMESLASKLPKTKSGTNSVIANMTIARLGANIGSKTLGKPGEVTGALGGISLVGKLAEMPRFQKAMENAYRRQGGRLDTGTRRWLEGKGYTKKDVDFIQDTMWGMIGIGYAHGSLEEIEKIKDPIKKKIEEIKHNYIY